MKFGKYLASRQLELPEYSGHFIDYKALKKLIKYLAQPPTTESDGFNSLPDLSQSQQRLSQSQQRLKENKASFFFKVERELDKVNSFYLEKQANLSINLDLLLRKKHEVMVKSAMLARQEPSFENSLMFKNSILFLNLYQSFKKIHQDLLRLQQFIELNEVGFLKVVKKWDKRSKSHTKELFIQSAVSVQPVFNRNEINEFSDLVSSSLFDLESIMDGDYTALRNVNISDASASSILNTRRSSLTQSHLDALNQSDPRTNQRPDFEPSHLSSVTSSFHTSEIDELYNSFVNFATAKVPDMVVFSRWLDKVQSSQNSPESIRQSLSEIFLLSIGNLKISDSFLEDFLKLVDYQIDFAIDAEIFNNKPIIHECCSVPPASSIESHVINNGVKVVNLNDSINHSRLFIVEYIIKTLPPATLSNLLVQPDMNGRTCLHYAAQNNRLDVLEILLPIFPKSHIDHLDKYSMSALLLAIKGGYFDVIKFLLENGSNCYPKSSDSKLQYLPINFACKLGDKQTLQYLLQCSNPAPQKINQQDVEGLFPLHVIASSGNYELVELLVQYGANINQLDGLNKWPPIFYAALKGYARTTQELIKFGARLDIVDEEWYNVLYHTAVEGHIEALNQLLSYNVDFPQSPAEALPTTEEPVNVIDDEEDVDLEDNISPEKDSIPHLQLPPPILPLRRYGHSFLEQKVLIKLFFLFDLCCINIFKSTTELRPGRITVSSNISDIVPRNILLPLLDGENGTVNCMFQIDMDSLNEFRIDFEIFPKFGTRLIAKTTALNFSQIDTSSPEVKTVLLPLFDLRLRNIGELKFDYQVIFPFSGRLLETTKYDTYWKSSASFVTNKPVLQHTALSGLSPNNFLSPKSNNSLSSLNGNKGTGKGTSSPEEKSASASAFVTATSLSGEYLRIKVCLLNDGTPIVCPHWAIAVAEDIELYLPNLSLDQLTSMTNSLFDYDKVIEDLSKMTLKELAFVKRLLKIIYLPLDILLDVLDASINISIELVFPSLFELEHIPFAGNIQLNLNHFIDSTLNNVFNHTRNAKKESACAGRSIIFLSSNSIVCKILNWKQPNFPVFLIMNGIVFNNNTHTFEARTANGILMQDLEKRRSNQSHGQSSGKIMPSTNHHQILANDQELTIRSIKEATNFAIDNNLIGIITSIHLLNLVPRIIPLIRSRGLVLVASNDFFEPKDNSEMYEELDTYTKTEINGMRFEDILSFKDDS